MSESLTDKIRRLRHERNLKRKAVAAARKRVAAMNRRIRKLNAALRRLTSGGVPPMNPGGWHPDAVENQSKAPLSWSTGRPKLVHHTTESSSLPVYSGSHPHFTLDPKTGRLWQHVPVRGGAYALANAAGGVETNRAHAIQVELIGFSDLGLAVRVGKPQYAVANWTDADYANIAKLARWVEKHCGVPRTCSVTFRNDATHKIRDWPNYTGHCGHQHVPENSHWDPSAAFKIGKVL